MISEAMQRIEMNRFLDEIAISDELFKKMMGITKTSLEDYAYLLEDIFNTYYKGKTAREIISDFSAEMIVLPDRDLNSSVEKFADFIIYSTLDTPFRVFLYLKEKYEEEIDYEENNVSQIVDEFTSIIYSVFDAMSLSVELSINMQVKEILNEGISNIKENYLRKLNVLIKYYDGTFEMLPFVEGHLKMLKALISSI